MSTKLNENKVLTLVLGDQLFENHPALGARTDFLMVESMDLCLRFKYHKQKIAFILASMRNFRDFLTQQTKGQSLVHYFTLDEKTSIESALKNLAERYEVLRFCEITEKSVSQVICDLGKSYFSRVEVLPSPMFLTTKEQFQEYLASNKGKKLRMANFYIWQRKRLGLFLQDRDQPWLGQWSFDEDNRKKLPKQIDLPQYSTPEINPNYKDVLELVADKFPQNPGSLQQVWLATTHSQAKQRLDWFLDNVLESFGPYEDAITDRSVFVFHSAISPYLNNGLLTPEMVIERLLGKVTARPELLKKNYSSVEGFVRQIIGWREWVKGLYDNVYTKSPDAYNFFGSNRELGQEFYFRDLQDSENIPLKYVLEKVENYGWAHHIERLMILSNYMTLSEYDPKYVYTWFMEMFVDAYEWVMIPNVLGMGTFADGGIFATKPYISGSNYIRKMSDYKPGRWSQEWDDLFWNFLEKHRIFFERQPRLGMLLKSRGKK